MPAVYKPLKIHGHKDDQPGWSDQPDFIRQAVGGVGRKYDRRSPFSTCVHYFAGVIKLTNPRRYVLYARRYVLWRSIRLLRIYSVNCVFVHYGGRYARFTTFRVRIFICGPIGRKWMSYYLKNGSLDLIPTFYDHCIRERGPLKKFLETSIYPIGRFLG